MRSGQAHGTPSKIRFWAHAQRLWLVGDAEQRPGVIGLSKCARMEPGGDAVRFAYDMGGAGGAKLGDEAMVAAAAKLDMVCNIFQDGVHGILDDRRFEANPATFNELPTQLGRCCRCSAPPG